MFKLQKKVSIKWSGDFAYAIGLIASDGNLSKDGRHMSLVSRDREMVNNFKKALALTNKISKHYRSNETEKKYFVVYFGDKTFYKFLNRIGLTSNKSKTISHVKVPDKYFDDFLRGLFDGDGSFYTYWDKRWPNSFGYKLSFASASPNFINWLKEKLTNLYGTRGYLHKGAGVINLEYVKGDSKKLYEIMYHKSDKLYLKRKYIKVKAALKKDQRLGLQFLQKQRNAVVA